MTYEPEDVEPFIARDAQPEELSARTLQMIDEAAENLQRGIVGPPVDPERLKRLAL